MISVLTATYNRALTLPRLYSSLLDQHSHDMEWIIIDDGSEDATREIVGEWLGQSAPFSISYIKTANFGKHVALNLAVRTASGDLSYIVDSDDWLPPQAIATINTWGRDVKGRHNVAAVAGLKAHADNTIPGGPALIPPPFIEVTNRERSLYRLMGDKGAEAYRTELLRAYPFPEFEGETFLHEALVWNRIADAGHTIRWHPDIVYYCEYQTGGLTDSSLENHLHNFRGYSLYMQEAISGLRGNARFRALGSYAEVASMKRVGVRQIARNTSSNIVEIWAALMAKRAYTGLRRLRLPIRPRG